MHDVPVIFNSHRQDSAAWLLVHLTTLYVRVSVCWELVSAAECSAVHAVLSAYSVSTKLSQGEHAAL